MARGKKNSVVIADRAAYAYAERLKGRTLESIAEDLQVSGVMVWKYCQEYMKKHVTPLAEEYRKMDLDRLDELLLALWPAAKQGDTKSIDAALRILDRRSKYLGLDAPTKVDATVVALDPKDIELRNLIEQARIDAGIEESAIKGELVPDED